MIDFTGRIDRVVSSNTILLVKGSPNRFGLGGFFNFKGAEICRGVKRGFFSGALIGEGDLGGGVGILSLLTGLSETGRPKGVFLRGILNSLTPSMVSLRRILNSLTPSMVSPLALVDRSPFLPTGASKAGRRGGFSRAGSFGREGLGGSCGVFGFGGDGLLGFSSEGGFDGDGLGAEDE